MPEAQTEISITLDFYYKDDCGLCDDMEAALIQYIDQRNYSEMVVIRKYDIETDAELFSKYREYIPVLVFDQKELCYYFFDESELDDVFSNVTGVF